MLRIADNIVRLRHDKKITQEKLAEFVGVTKASVSKWENSQSTPDITILPQLAAFFNVTVDELIGYTPQLSKEQIQKLYQRFGKDFGRRHFEEVMKETEDYVKHYYSCWPFLLQICILWLNHYKMTEDKDRQKDICLRIVKLCEHIQENCQDMQIHGTAVVIRALIYFQTGHIQEVVDELEEFSASARFGNQSSVLLAQAYAMLGEQEKAYGYAQISMYDNIMNLLANAACYLQINMAQQHVILFFIRLILLKQIFICFHEHFCTDTLSEKNQCTCIKWWSFLITGQTDEVLQIGIFRYLLHKLPVRKLKPGLNNQSAKGHAQRLCNIPGFAFEKMLIFLFEDIPRDHICHLNPAVFRIHMQSHRLVEIEEGCL